MLDIHGKWPNEAMIYTIGKTEIYESYISNDAHPQKAIGGSVWETLERAQSYLDLVDLQHEYHVYGVLADWETQTIEHDGQEWHDLLIDADLVKIKE